MLSIAEADLLIRLLTLGKIKIWDLQAALDPRSQATSLCIKTLTEHTGRVFRLQFDEFQIVSSSHDDTILCFNFLHPESPSLALQQQQASPVLDQCQLETLTTMDSSVNVREAASNLFQSQASVQSSSSSSGSEK
jgi:hypothetical protein